jgi:hypothetical protein
LNLLKKDYNDLLYNYSTLKAENEAFKDNSLSLKERVTTANTKMNDTDYDKSISEIKSYNKNYNNDDLDLEFDEDGLDNELDLLKRSFHNMKEMRETLRYIIN